MSNANQFELNVQYKLTKDLSVNIDEVVTGIDVSNIQNKQIKRQTVDFSDKMPKVAVLSNYSINDIVLRNGTVKDGKPVDLVTLQMPLSVDGKSRNFYMRFDAPTDCKYTFVDCDGISPIKVQSNIDLPYYFDSQKAQKAPYIFECYELTQNPTTFYIGSQNQLSSINVGIQPIRPSKIN